MLFRLIVIDVVPFGAEVLVMSGTEADENFIPPRPDTMVGRPPAEATVDIVDRQVADVGRLVIRVRGAAEESESRYQSQAHRMMSHLWFLLLRVSCVVEGECSSHSNMNDDHLESPEAIILALHTADRVRGRGRIRTLRYRSR